MHTIHQPSIHQTQTSLLPEMVASLLQSMLEPAETFVHSAADTIKAERLQFHPR
jgi:hypothetical protein